MKAKTALYFLAAIVMIVTGIGCLIYLSFNIVLQIIGAMGSWALFGILIFYLFTSVPAFQGAGAWIARGLSFWKTGEKSSVALNIEQNLNAAQEEINSEAKGIIPYHAKVEWISKASYLDTNEEAVVIRMREHKENPRNVAYAVIDYISKGMIPYSRPYIEKPIQVAMDSIMIKKILLQRNKAALDYFLVNVMGHSMATEDVQKYVDIIGRLEERGLFTRIYLEDIKELGLELYPKPDQNAVKETKQYVEHLDTLAKRRKGELGGAGPFNGRIIKVGYVLVAEPQKLRTRGFLPYIEYSRHCVDDGVEVLYLLSRGGKNRAAMKLASTIALTCKMDIVNTSEYEETVDTEKVRCLCIELRL